MACKVRTTVDIAYGSPNDGPALYSSGPNDSGLRKGPNRFRRLFSSEAEVVNRETNVVKSERQLAAEAKDAVTEGQTAQRTKRRSGPIDEALLPGPKLLLV